MNDLYRMMLSAYDTSSEQKARNAAYEISQQIILSGLSRAGFFDVAAFYGGTCLRIFHGMQRFSEDMDFTLLAPTENFDFTHYFPAVIDEFSFIGRNVEIKRKEKTGFGHVESAFLKDNTDVYDVTFQTQRSLKIKIEVDTAPPLMFNTEYKLLLQPSSFMTRCLTLPDLFAGKMHALVFRTWKNRVKGRDWYDFEWYIRHDIPLNYTHLHERILEFNGRDMTKVEFLDCLRQRLSCSDMQAVKDDVRPFLRNTDELAIWTNTYFLQLADRLRFV